MAARAGVGTFTLVDPEALAVENVGRHVLSRESVGQLKVKAVKRAIKSVNPAAEVRAIAHDFRNIDPAQFLNGKKLDLLIGATDSFACNSMVNSLSLERNIPALYAACWGEATIGEVLYVVPGKTPCFECYAGFRRDEAPLPRSDPLKYTDPDYDGTKMPGQAGLWSNILAICGIAFQVVLALLDPESVPGRNLIDHEHTVFFANVGAYDSPLQPLAVTFGRVANGCPVCDESKLRELSSNLAE